MPYDLNPLGYEIDALEPHVPADELRHHRDVVHRRYTDALNAVLADHPDLAGRTVEDLLRRLDDVPPGIRQQVSYLAGGHANHQFLWKILAPQSAPAPVGSLAAEIDSVFGSFDAFRTAFEAAADRLGMEGWVFLSLSRARTGDLEILALPGNGSVLPIAKPGILICDLWDHGAGTPPFPRYWNIVDWKVGNDRYLGLRDGRTHL